MITARLFRKLLFCCILLGLFTVSAAQPQTRAPQGDNAEAPKSILLNQKKTVNGVETATRQGDAVEATSCDPLNNSQNSVWFAFEVPSAALIDVDASGSILNFENFTISVTTVTLYRVNGPVLEEVDCDTDSGARLLDVELEKGSYKVRVASPGLQLAGPSSYRLGVRARALGQLGNDTGFIAPLGTAWKVKNAGDPAKIFKACSDNCVRFDGVAGGKLLTKFNWADLNIKTIAGDSISTNIFVNDTPPGGSDIRITIQLIYSDGTPSNRQTVMRNAVLPATDISMGIGAATVEIKSKALKTVKVVISSPTANDTFSVVDASVYMMAGSNLRGLLPVP
jgi:hypothetical protein